VARGLGPSRVRLGGWRGLGGSGGGAAPAWTPASLTNLRGWYRADLGTLDSGGSPVSSGEIQTWQDQSGNGNHLEAPLAAARPTLNATGFNGGARPYLSSAGDYLRDTSFSWGAAAGAITYAMIGVVTVGGVVRYFFDYTPDAGTNRFYNFSTSGNLLQVSGAGAGIGTSTGTSSTTTARLFWSRWSGTTQQVGSGGTQEDSDANTHAAFVDNGSLTIAASFNAGTGFQGHIAEVIVMRAALSAGELASLSSYANTRYGVPA
jgi:hypothetical protein